jgi:hypothetical protein
MGADSYHFDELADAKWRIGRKLGRTIYAQLWDEPSDDDPLLGIMDREDLAALVVYVHNSSINR